MADIVQVIGEAADLFEGMFAAGDIERAKADQLRAYRDLIEEYRKAWAARLNGNTSTAFMERMHATERALLASCREVGT